MAVKWASAAALSGSSSCRFSRAACRACAARIHSASAMT